MNSKSSRVQFPEPPITPASYSSYDSNLEGREEEVVVAGKPVAPEAQVQTLGRQKVKRGF
jgi:hypothetical protein